MPKLSKSRSSSIKQEEFLVAKPFTVNRIVTHCWPHLDEIVAIWLLWVFGQKLFPGVPEAPVEFWGDGNQPPDGKSWQEHEAEGTLFIGIGGGRFDEHPADGSSRKVGECTATLVARHLGLLERRELDMILEHVRKEDLEAGFGAFSLGSIVKSMHKSGMDPKWVMNWVFDALDAKLKEQETFLAALNFLDGFVLPERLAQIGGKSHTLVVVTTANPETNRAAGYRHFVKGGSVTVVQSNPDTGHHYIFVRGPAQQRLPEIARQIRLAERSLHGCESVDFQALLAEGRVAGAECWWLAAIGLFNGSLTATDVPPSKLSLDEIVACVKRAFAEGSTSVPNSSPVPVAVEA
ncbi:MAG: hypothetical protein AAB364_02715 [Patescibacteria group bacterium]